MTTAELSPMPVEIRPTAQGSRTVVALAAAAAAAVTLLIRLALHTSGFDLYGDEIVYTELGRSVLSGGFPEFENGIFFLHGPAFFYLEAAWARLVGTPHDLMSLVYSMRTLNALLAGATAGVMVLVGTRISSLRSGLVAAALFAVDPFCIRQNDRVLLETSMMLLVLLGYLLFIPLTRREASGRLYLRAIGAGILFGCAALTKDEGALITVLPLVVAAAFGWGPRRPFTLITIGSAVAVYGAYVAVVAASDYFGFYWQTKTYGIQRMLGLIQLTGFNSSGGGDLWARVVAQLSVFWTTYLTVALALPMMLLVLRYGFARSRILALLYTASALTLAYALFFGTLEEQELYLLVLPSQLVIPVAVTEFFRRRSEAGTTPLRLGRLQAAAAITLLAALGLNAVTCVQWLRNPDDSFIRLYGYITAHVPPGSVVGVVDGDISTPYLLYGTSYQVGQWETPAALAAAHARYLVVEWGSIADGFSDLTTGQVHQLVGRGQPVFSQWGRTYGQLVLYKLPASAGPLRPAAKPTRQPMRKEGVTSAGSAHPPK